MKIIDLIVGARPNFMKIAPIIDAIKKAQKKGSLLTYRLIHTGQHYDASMSGNFLDQLGIPDPDYNLGVGSGTQATQTANIMTCYEDLLTSNGTNVALCLVVGDVTSTMACAITARKLGVPVAHVEAGIRSGDWTMPEEINRLVTDSITSWFFTTSQTANTNLRQSGISDDKIFFVGNTMIDTLYKQLPYFQAPTFWNELNLNPQEYFVVTLHRPSNVDSTSTFLSLLETIIKNSRGLPVIYPVHPRTARVIEKLKSQPNNLHLVEPQPYLEFNYLVKHAKAVITDSGGITEETTVMGVPCLTLRDSTERPETITIGTNVLLGSDRHKLKLAMDNVSNNKWKKGGIPELWDGNSASRIINHLENILQTTDKAICTSCN